MNVKINLFGDIYDVVLKKEKYINGNIALSGECYSPDFGFYEPFATFSVNFPEKLPENQIYIKDYSENSGFMQQLINQDIISKPIRTFKSGFVDIHVCKILI